MLETANAIQMTIVSVLRQLQDGTMEPYRASIMFQGLQLARQNRTNMENLCDFFHLTQLTPAMEQEYAAAAEQPQPVWEQVPSPAPATEPCGTDIAVCDASEARAMSDEERALAIYDSAFRSNHLPPEEARIEGYRRILLIGPSSSRYEEAKRELAALEAKQKNEPPVPVEPTGDHRPPEDFLDAPVVRPAEFKLREELYPANAIRRYWTQHLPEDLKNSRAYEPPEWLPLTREEFAYMRDHMGASEPRTTEQRRFCERLVQHNSQRGIVPPKEDVIRKSHDELEADKKKSMPELLLSALHKLQTA